MEEQSSILIQKKTIFVMTFIILFASLIYAKKDFYISNNEENLVATAQIEASSNEVITQEVETKNIAYTAVTQVTENSNAHENVYKSEPERIINSTSSVVAADNIPTEYEDVLSMSATAYCLCKKCCGKTETHPEYGITASGYRIKPGTNEKVIAVDTSIIPLGTKVYVEGLNGASSYGYAIAADTGSAIKNMKIDLYMDSHEDALRWGFKKVNVYLLED